MNGMNKKWMAGCWMMLLVGIMASCASGDNYESALPKDAALVVSVNPASMAEKSGLAGEEGTAVVQKLGDALKSGMQGSEQLIDKMMDDPDESGIDFRKDMYFFVESQTVSAGILARVSHAGKLEALFDELGRQQICSSLKEEDGCTWTVLGNVLAAYTSDALLLLTDPNGGSPQDMRHTASMLLRQNENEGYRATPDFGLLKKGKGDIVALGSLDLIPGKYVTPMLMGISGDLKLEDVKYLAEIRFGQGKMTVDFTDLTTDAVMKRMKEQQLQAFGEIEGEYLDCFPANTGFWMSVHIDGKKMYELLCGHPVLGNQLENSMMPVDFEAIFHALKGDMAVAGDVLSGTFIAYADVTDDRFLQTFEDLKPLLALTGGQMRLFNRGASGYEFRMQDGSVIGMRPGNQSLWFGVSEGRFYLTNHADLINARVPGLTLRDCPWGKSVKGKRCFYAMNLGALAENAQSVAGRPELQALGFVKGLDYLTIEGVNAEKSRMELVMKDSQINILSSLLSAFK